MGLFSWIKVRQKEEFGKASGNPGAKSISDISLSQREEIIAMRENGMLPKEIAEETGIEVTKVSKVIENDRLRRSMRMAKGSDPLLEDPVERAKRDLAAAQLDLQKARLEFDLKKIRAEMEDYFGEDDEEDEPAGDPADMMMATLLQGIMKGKQPPVSPQTPPQPQEIMVTHVAQEASLDDEQIKQRIDQFIQQYGKKKVLHFAKQPDETLMPILKTQIPGYDEDTYRRALDMLKKME